MDRLLCCVLFCIVLAFANSKHDLKHCISKCLPNDKNFDSLNGDKFIWGLTEDKDVNLFNRINTEHCLHNICEEEDSDTNQEIESILDRNQELITYFGTIVQPHKDVSVVSRFSDEEDKRNMCSVNIKSRRPTSLENLEGVNRIIVNTEKYHQIVRYEYCAREYCWCEVCYKNSVAPKCKQQYITLQLLTFEKDNKTFTYDTFSIPSGCVCGKLE